MSTKASITGGKWHHLYFQEYLDAEPKNVFLEITGPSEFSITKETTQGRIIENLVVEIPDEVMDDIAIAWIKERGLQGAIGDPAGTKLATSND